MIDLFAHGVVAVDTEGDGYAPPEPVEISVVGFDLVDILSVAGWRIDPGRRISPFATRVHGLRDRDVRGCPSFAAVASEVSSAITGKAILGHAVGNDLHLLRHKLPGLETGPVIDTHNMTKRLSRGHASYGLHKLGEDLGIAVPEQLAGRGEHSSTYDALLTIGLFRHLVTLDGAEAYLRSAGVRLDGGFPAPR